MKKLMLYCLVILSLISLSAQEMKEVNVSEKVKVELKNLFPKANNVIWIKNLEIINASFTQEGKQVGVIFKADTLFATMNETEITALPEPVKKHFDKYYKDYSIMRAGKMHFATKPDKNNIAYGADITNGTISKRILCYPNGEEMSVSNLPNKKKN